LNAPLEEVSPYNGEKEIGCSPEDPMNSTHNPDGRDRSFEVAKAPAPANIPENESQKMIKAESLLGAPDRMEFSLLDFQE